MTTEAAILGIPTIQLHPKAHLFGNFIELQRYGLIFSFTHSNQAMDKIMEISNENNLKNEWKRKRERLLADCVDIVPFMTNIIKNNGINYQ